VQSDHAPKQNKLSLGLAVKPAKNFTWADGHRAIYSRPTYQTYFQEPKWSCVGDRGREMEGSGGEKEGMGERYGSMAGLLPRSASD